MNPTEHRMLISVHDKTGLEEFGKLTKHNWEIISTGDTAAALKGFGIPYILVEEVAGFPEMTDGHLEIPHPKIFGGILADRRKPKHMEECKKQGIKVIGLVVVNLYDFQGNPRIETIDIGGSSLIRAAAKNCDSVTVVVDPADYNSVINEMIDRGVGRDWRVRLAYKAFHYAEAYDRVITDWFAKKIINDERIFG